MIDALGKRTVFIIFKYMCCSSIFFSNKRTKDKGVNTSFADTRLSLDRMFVSNFQKSKNKSIFTLHVKIN